MTARMDDLQIAAAWLECNEGDSGESDACQRVATYLRAELARREGAQLKRLAKRHGTSVENIRWALGKAAP